MILLNYNIPVNSPLFQSKTFGLGKSCCILCRNGVQRIQFGMLHKNTIDLSLFISNKCDFFSDQLKIHVFHIQNTCVWALKTKVKLIFHFYNLLS